MSFLEEFDNRAQHLPPVPGTETPGSEDKELLDFADLIRSRRALPSSAERERALQRVRFAEAAAAERRRSSHRFWWVLSAAALLALAVGLGALMQLMGTFNRPIRPNENLALQHSTNASKPVESDSTIDDTFANMKFPAPVLASTDSAAQAVEIASGEPVLRALRVHGLVVFRAKGEERWHVLKRGQALKSGDTLRSTVRLESSARILAADGSSVSIGPGAVLHCEGPRAWSLDEGMALFEAASRADLPNFRVSTPDGSATAKGTRFFLEVSKRNANEPRKNQTLCRVDEGSVEAVANAQTRTLAARETAFLNLDGVVTAGGASGDSNWLKALENEMNSDHGIGQLVAKAEKINEHLPLEIASHTVTVTCVDQVARTFVDEEFANHTDRELEGTFYYPLPPDAAISEFAMYVDGKRIVGEVLEQAKARQVFEYIVRQQKDPALLEWAGGNLFKMRVYPIPAHSTKRVQLGYTQILPRRNGSVSYTYPLYSEMLLKNPLQKLNIEFRVLSNLGLADLASPTHLSGVALDPDGRRGTLAFRAQKYSPSRDFTVSYKVPDGVECAAAGNTHPDDTDPYFMLQLCPKATLPARKPPERLLVIVDGSASAGAQDYSVATEFAASCADVSSQWQMALMRGGQLAEPIDLQMTRPATPAGGFAFATTDEQTSTLVRNVLVSKPALGATDLLATFQKAAEFVADGKGLEIVYVGDGVDTLNESSGPVLVEKIAALFKGKNAHVSTVAIGSSYERPVLQGLAGALGGTFTHVEGAADVHAAVDQVFDSFYRPQFWNARVKIDGIETSEVHPQLLGTLAASDTAVVLGRFKGPEPKIAAAQSFNARVTFSADIEGGTFERAYDAQIVAGNETNTFIPRLWARAHAEALMAQAGLGTTANDTRIKNDVTANSIKYQIMSPYTSFLVLDSEDAYRQYDIKRTMKRVDWMGDGLAAESKPRGKNNLGGATHARFSRGDSYNFDSSTSYFGSVDLGLDGSGLGLDDWAEASNSWSLAGAAGPVSDTRVSGRMFRLGEKGKSVSDKDISDFESENDFDSLSNLSSLSTLPEPVVPLRYRLEVAEKSGYLQQQEVFYDSKLGGLADDEFALYDIDSRLGRRSLGFQYAFESEGVERGALYKRGWSGRYNPHAYFSSLVFPNGQTAALGNAPAVPFEFKPDQPLKSAAHYQRVVLRKGDNPSVRLNWVLALEADENYARALKELAPLLDKFPGSAELKLEQGLLLLRDAGTAGDQPGQARIEEGLAALNDARKAAGGDSKMDERIIGLLSNLGRYKLCAEQYEMLARKAGTAEDAAKFGGSAAQNWQNAGTREKGNALWEDLLKRWPDSAPVKAGAGNWLLQFKPKDERGLKLLREGAANEPKSKVTLVYALMRAGLKDEALAEARKVLDTAPDQAGVYSMLTILAQSQRTAIAESKRLLNGPCTVAQYGAVVQYWSAYSVKGDKEFTKLIVESLTRTDFPAVARAQAAYNLLIHAVGGMTAEKMAELVTQLVPSFDFDPKKGVEETTLVANAVSLLMQRDKKAEALALAQAALKRMDAKDERRMPLLISEFQALAGLNREGEFFTRYDAEFFGDNPSANEKQIAHVTDAVLGNLGRKKDLDGIAQRVNAFMARYPNSGAGNALHAHAAQLIAQMKKGTERDAVLEGLVKKYPADAFYADMQARSLAQKGKIREAVAVVRTVLDAKAPPSASQRGALINLLARLSAQETALRDAFLREADDRSKTQDPVVREWTEAALTCMYAAGEQDKYLGTLFSYFLHEPGDPEWGARLAAGLVEAGKFVEARAVYETLAKADPDDSTLAFTCRDICLKLKDAKAAQEWFDVAFEALAKHPNKLSQFAYNQTNNNPEWSLKTYKRLAQDSAMPMYTLATQAAAAAQNLGRTAEAIDWHFKSLFAPDAIYVSSVIVQLAQLAQQEKEYRVIEPRALAALNDKPDNSKAIAAHLLLHRLKKLKQDAAGARAELDAALKIDLPEQNYSYLASAIFEALALENLRDKCEDYALSGGGSLDDNQRQQLMRSAVNNLQSDKDRPAAIRLYRKLLESEDYNREEDRRQLIERLVANNEIDAAAAETRKLDESTNSWSVWHSWQLVVAAYRDRKNFAASLDLAFSMCERLKDDNSYNSNALRELAESVLQAQKAGKLDAARGARASALIRACTVPYFEGSEDHRYSIDYLVSSIKAIGMKDEFDALARQAEESGDVKRLNAAAHYMERQQRYTEARRIYERTLSIEHDNRPALLGVYDICAFHVTDWDTALKTVERLAALKDQDEVWLMTARVRCLEGLKRREEARTIASKLMKKAQFLQSGYWSMQNFARELERAGDYELATEAWELTIRMLRAHNRGRIEPSSAAQFYTACGQAYAQSGNAGKALDCFLRGMSVIPRHDRNYQTVLQAALDNVLKGKSLSQAVAAHENNVAADGNDKPHLRLAFAEAFKKENKTREMLTQLHAAADLLPKDMKLRQEVIDGYKALRDTDAAIEEYRRWAALDPQNIELYRGWGDLYDSMGRRADAILAWATMAEVRPREAEGYRAYGQKLASVGEHEKAASAFRQAVRYRPTEYDIAKELADEYKRSGSSVKTEERIAKVWSEGEAASRKAMEDVADDPTPWLNLGRFLEAQSKTKEARELYEKILVRPWPRFHRETTDEARKRLNQIK